MRRQHERSVLRAFTLIEVLMVIVILGMLAGVAVMSFRGVRDKARRKTTQSMIANVEKALDVYENDMLEFPDEDQGLAALVKKPEYDDEKKAKAWAGPYLKKVPEDGWGNELMYARVEDGGDEENVKPFTLYSKGPDGQEDNDDDVHAEDQDTED